MIPHTPLQENVKIVTESAVDFYNLECGTSFHVKERETIDGLGLFVSNNASSGLLGIVVSRDRVYVPHREHFCRTSIYAHVIDSITNYVVPDYLVCGRNPKQVDA